jgi:uncharacterized protein (TIGR02246 family)
LWGYQFSKAFGKMTESSGAKFMKTAIFSGIVAAYLAFSGVQTASAADQPNALDKGVSEAIKAKISAYEKAFNTGDAAATAKMWAPDGCFINTSGLVSTGRDQLEKLHAKIFSEKPAKVMKLHVGSLVQSGPDAIVERGVAALLDDKRNAVARTPYIAVHRKVDGDWLLQSVVEMSPQQIAYDMSDLAWLLGSWKSTGGDNSVTLTSRLQPGGKLMVSDFEIIGGGGKTAHEMMVTAVNPHTGDLVSWVFADNGSYGRARWVQEGGQWLLLSQRVAPNGTTIEATHILSRDTDNTMKWETVKRTANGVTLADVPAVTITRTTR